MAELNLQVNVTIRIGLLMPRVSANHATPASTTRAETKHGSRIIKSEEPSTFKKAIKVTFNIALEVHLYYTRTLAATQLMIYRTSNN